MQSSWHAPRRLGISSASPRRRGRPARTRRPARRPGSSSRWCAATAATAHSPRRAALGRRPARALRVGRIVSGMVRRQSRRLSMSLSAFQVIAIGSSRDTNGGDKCPSRGSADRTDRNSRTARAELDLAPPGGRTPRTACRSRAHAGGSRGHRDQIAGPAQDQRQAPRRRQPDRSQRDVDHRRLLRGPAQEARDEAAQLDEPAALRDQRQAADAELDARIEPNRTRPAEPVPGNARNMLSQAVLAAI
jgi:hypothetical protein